MILVVDAVVMSLVCGLLTGGRFASLTRFRLRAEPLLLGSLVAQAILPRVLPVGVVDDLVATYALWVLPALMVMSVLLVNGRHPGLAVAAAGIGLNLLVVLANGGMPVLESAAGQVGIPIGSMARHLAESWLHIQADHNTRLLVLADVLPIPGPAWHSGLASLGDVFFATGIGHFLFSHMHSYSVHSCGDSE